MVGILNHLKAPIVFQKTMEKTNVKQLNPWLGTGGSVEVFQVGFKHLANDSGSAGILNEEFELVNHTFL